MKQSQRTCAPKVYVDVVLNAKGNFSSEKRQNNTIPPMSKHTTNGNALFMSHCSREEWILTNQNRFTVPVHEFVTERASLLRRTRIFTLQTEIFWRRHSPDIVTLMAVKRREPSVKSSWTILWVSRASGE